MKHETALSQAEIPPNSRLNPRVVFIGYLLHLLVPALLLTDIFMARLRGEIELIPFGPETAIALVSALWLLAGLGFFFLSRDRQVFLARVATPLVSLYAVFVTLIALEAMVRLINVTPPIPQAQTPGTKATTKMDPAVTPGVSGLKHFTINQLGLRGPMPPKDGKAYRIMAVGGSTTICTNLDDTEEWPHQLMKAMNASENTRPVWVGNAGAAGRNTIHHIILMQWLPGIMHVDMVIFLVGVNDLTATLAFGGAPTQTFLEKEAKFQGDLPPGKHWRSPSPFFRRLKLVALAHEAGRNLFQPPRRSGSLPLLDIEELRKRRAAGPVLPLPDLTIGLKEYRARLLTLASQCRDLQLRCLFLTQPTMWRDDLTPDEKRLLWLGYTGRWERPDGYVSAGGMAHAMDLYNRTLREVCDQSGLECYDIASEIPKNTSVFFDEMHYNEAGARLMAGDLKQYLLSKPPFDPQRALR